MIGAWMLFSIATACAFTGAAMAADHVAMSLRHPRRFIWGVAMITTIGWPAISLVLPAIPDLRSSVTSEPTAVLSEIAHPSSFAVTAPFAEVDPRWDSVLLAAWLLASSVLLIRLAVALRHLRRSRRTWRATEIDGVRIQIATDAGPAVIGLRPMHVVIPEWVLGMEPDLRVLVLRHELEHRTAGDPYLLLAATLVTALFPWNVALWVQAQRLRLAIELDCDSRVLRVVPRWREYARLLLAIAQRRGGATEPLTLALSENTSNLERRITAMRTSSTHSRFRVACFCVTASAAFALACAVDPPKSSNTPSPDPATSPFFEFQVDKPVVLQESVPPQYPTDMKQSGVGGEVQAQYVVDETGLVDVETFKVLKSPDPRLSAAVKAALPAWRFEPAVRQGKKVRQVVQQSFVFRPPTAA